MKRKLSLCLLLANIWFVSGYACSTFTPYISGSPEIDPTTAGSHQFTMVMDAAYKNSSGGYFGTQWTLSGNGITPIVAVSGETVTFNTGAWTIPDGTYTLTARNQFGSSSSCYGCISNTTFSRSDVHFARYRPDLVVTCGTYDDPNNTGALSGSTTLYVSITVTNNGDANSSPTSVKIAWVNKNGNNSYNPSDPECCVPALAPGQSYTNTITQILTPNPTVSEDWTMTWTVDPNNYVKEHDETNNSKVYTKRINRLGGRMASTSEASDQGDIVVVMDMSGNVIWRKGTSQLDMQNLKGLYIFGYDIKGEIVRKKVFVKPS